MAQRSMIRISVALALACVCVLAPVLGCASASARGSLLLAAPDLRAEIVAANRELERRFNAGDMAGVAAMYTDDAEIVSRAGADAPGVRRTRGREAIDASWARTTDPVSWTLEVFEVRGSGNIAHELGRSTLRRRRDGIVSESVVDFSVFWSRQADGRWRIESDCYWPATPGR